MKEALGTVGVARFIQQFDLGKGNYTEEKPNEPDVNLEEIDVLLRKANNE